MFKLPKAHFVALLAGATSLFTGSLQAGSAIVGTPKPSAETAGPDFGLTGDWGGFRTTLRDAGIEVAGSYVGEVFGVIRGGRSRGDVFDGLAKLSLDFKLEQLVGWQGGTFHASFLYPHGTSVSGASGRAGDISLISNIDAYDTFRLVDFWFEQRLLDDKLSLKLGQMRVDDEFGVTDSASMFINGTFGVPSAAVSSMPMANYPVGGLGVRARYEPIKGLYGQVGLYDGNPSSGDFVDPTTGLTGGAARHGTDWSLRHSEGFLWASEVGYQQCCRGCPGAYRLGFLHHTDGVTPGNIGLTPSGTDGSNTSAYFVIDQTIWQKSADSKEGVAAFLRGVTAQESRNPMNRSLQGGLTYSGLVKADDKLGVAYAHNRISRFNTSIPNGDFEGILEVTYQYPVLPYLTVQPDFQLIRHPGGSTALHDAWVLGVRAVLTF